MTVSIACKVRGNDVVAGIAPTVTSCQQMLGRAPTVLRGRKRKALLCGERNGAVKPHRFFAVEAKTALACVGSFSQTSGVSRAHGYPNG
jgi:hypothetical protein